MSAAGIAFPAELEAAIRAAPDDPGGYAVAADWLQQHGEPHGELVALALRNVSIADVRYAALQQDLERGLYLLGGVLATWRWGFAWRLRILSATPAQLRSVLAHPAARFIRELVFDRTVTAEHVSVLLAEATGALTSVRELALREPDIEVDTAPADPDDLAALVAALPALTCFDAPSAPAHLAAPRLRELVARTGLETVHAPALHTLAIPAAGVAELAELLARSRLPALRRLTVLARADAPWATARLPPDLELFDVIPRHAVGTRRLVVDHVGTAGEAALVNLSATRWLRPLAAYTAVALGRTLSTQPILFAQYLRRSHVALENRGESGWFVVDHSTDAGWLNGHRAYDAPLRSGDVITTGLTTLRFVQGDLRAIAADLGLAAEG